MSTPNATVHLNRAWRLMGEVNGQLEQLHHHVLTHNETVQQDGPFVASLVSSFQSSGRLGAQKSSLYSDLQLASSEVDSAAAIDPDATIKADEGVLGIEHLRGVILRLRGSIELIAGSGETARQLYLQSLQFIESPDTYFWLGVIHEDRYDPQWALHYFEKSLELDPDGELSVAALREANRMRNYRKGFRGDWTILILSLLCCLPFAPIYYYMKYK
jgi:tetratricopeptide (TPR) repeat protein